jgi:predicted enzyme related to lactoylglutathione lyase
VDDVETSVGFYRDLLGWEPYEVCPGRATFATGTLPVSIESGSCSFDGRRIRHTGYLLVLHTAEIDSVHAGLVSRGLSFSGHKVSSTAPGKTARFKDPSGHQFCLYEPSEEALSWSSGPKIRQLIGVHG